MIIFPTKTAMNLGYPPFLDTPRSSQYHHISPIIFGFTPQLLAPGKKTDRPAATHLFGFVHIGEAALAILLHRRRVGDKSLDLGVPWGTYFKKKDESWLTKYFQWISIDIKLIKPGNQDMFTNISRMGYLNLHEINFSRCTKSMGCSHHWDDFVRSFRYFGGLIPPIFW